MSMHRWGVVVLAAAVVCTACGGPDNVYVSNNKAGVYLKLPPTYGTFDYEAGDPTADRLTDQPGTWRVGFDGAPEPSRAHLEGNIAPKAPVGFVQVVPIDAGSIDGQQGLRSVLVGGHYDPLDPTVSLDGTGGAGGSGSDGEASSADDPSYIDPSSLAVLDYEEVDVGHAYGNQIHATIGAGRTELEITQIAMLNNAGDRVQLLRVLCSPDCYKDHEHEIDAIVRSWLLEDR
jgi:hypothetical protein